MNAFLTGSHVYGIPTKESDIDLVVLVDETVGEFLWSKSQFDNSVRFGKLNLVLVYDKKEFLAWKDATYKLEQEKPVTRQQAIKTIQSVFVERNIDLQYEI
jgi:hypothetical protein